ncbi:MAG: hypothetical protein IJB96_10105, partial [Lachnospira sp.]|nr:hypothetical protein [Lachnospira sp.]
EISYKIRAKSDYSLIENTVVEEFELKDNRAYAILNIKNLIREDEEYYLEIVLKTDKHEAVSYYTAFMKDTGFKLSDKINYVLNFNACTLDEKRLSEIAGNLETSKNADNTNYGKVDITNSKAMVGWGDLKPFVESNIVPSVYMVDEEVAVVALDYTVGVENTNGSFDTFVVHEFYRVRQTSARFYLLNYDRQMTQVFDGKSDLISTGKVNLGIAPKVEAHAMADAKNNFVYFVNSGSLWCFDKTEHVYSKVFAFESADSDNVRERYDDHDIKIMSVDEDGSGYFLVYGYMNRGEHEGQVGVSLFRYNYASNDVTEKLYIPMDVSAEVLCNSIGEIAHVTASNSLYIKIDDTLYLIDLESKETMTEAKGLIKGTYSVSENEKVLAYHVGGGETGAESVRVFNIETGKDYYINAEEGQVVKVLGFIENDFIYGYANKDDVIVSKDGSVSYAMYKLSLMDSEFQEIRSYQTEGYYITKASVQDYRVNLDRVRKDEAGHWVSASIDQLINRNENVEFDELTVSTITTAGRKKQVVLELAGDYNGGSDASLRNVLNVDYKVTEEPYVLPGKVVSTDKFYIRGYGSYISTYDTIEDAINEAQLQYGRVYDSEYNLVWKRFKAAQYSISGLASAGCSREQSYDMAKKIVKDFATGENVEWLAINSVTVEYVLPFVGLGCPVVADTPNGYVIITGYTTKEVTYLNVMTGKSVTVSNSDAITLFSQAGNTFATYYKK